MVAAVGSLSTVAFVRRLCRDSSPGRGGFHRQRRRGCQRDCGGFAGLVARHPYRRSGSRNGPAAFPETMSSTTIHVHETYETPKNLDVTRAIEEGWQPDVPPDREYRLWMCQGGCGRGVLHYVGDDTGGYWCLMCQSQIKGFNRQKNPAWQESMAKARETMRQKREENAG